MWVKMFRSKQSMVYRRRYKCPICEEYTLLLIHDHACECMEGCDDEAIDVKKVQEKNDFDGYFTQEDIKEYFWIDYEKCEKLFKQTVQNTLPYLIKKNENKKIEEFFQNSYDIDNRLDDVVAKYCNYFRINEIVDYKPYNYLVTLVEDMHFYMNLTCKDIYLLDLSLSKMLPYSNYMYSGRFFGNNAIDHLFQANERMYVILGLIYQFNYNEDLSKNRSYEIKRHIKKDIDYKNNFSQDINDLNGNKLYNELEEIRNSNEHDLSYMIKKFIEEKKDININSNEADKEFYLPIVKNLIFCIEKMYDIINKIIDKIDLYNIYNLSSFPMYEQFKDENTDFKFRVYNYQSYKELASYNDDIIDNTLNFAGNSLISDTYFRMDEILHCIRDIYNYCNNSSDISLVEFGDFIGIDYIIYSAVTRLYSCYDKISRYLASQYREYKEIKYFNDFNRIKSNSTNYRLIKGVLDNEAYIMLQKIRNIIYHNLRAGIIFGVDGEKYYNKILIQLIMENELLLFSILKAIRPIKNHKIERNSPCPCGSQKKYKYCHGRAQKK